MPLDDSAIGQAAALLAQVRTSGHRLRRLPEHCRPRDLDDAFRIQHATCALLGESIAGWKVGSVVDGRVPYGIVIASRQWDSGVRARSTDVPLLGIEAEVAFRFARPAPPRAEAYSPEEVADLVEPFCAIEIVDSRYLDYAGTPPIERTADFMSNGALVLGTRVESFPGTDLAQLTVALSFDNTVVTECTGGHASGDPLRPAVDLVNALRREGGVPAGRLMTTGTFTGLHYAKPGQCIRATFRGIGTVELQLD